MYLLTWLYNYLNLNSIPFQPSDGNKRDFTEEVKTPLWIGHNWSSIQPKVDFVNLSYGIEIKTEFPDPDNLLETAYEDLVNFFKAGNVKIRNGRYIIETHFDTEFSKEAFQIDVSDKKCVISASDIEGIRRGIFYIEDEMLRNGGAFLQKGSYNQSPVFKTLGFTDVFLADKQDSAIFPGLMVLGMNCWMIRLFIPDNYA